ncbi:hypothetical protein [Gemmatimonas groenlandica]|uniref:Uncharacterized protein n=1 Tax=Gemmatimonas groenlandica TaxID=2732249 RepID=A0A6M4IL07_9BACT|nr:hypothetical protein [Gemmatimonas groenlandica]QJR35403.1 hypothetical protein HKW67_07730 [Gemmatimonas groenlandica]
MSPIRALIRNSYWHLLHSRLTRAAALAGIWAGALGTPLLAQVAAPTSPAPRGWRFAENVVLHIPGSSRFAGDIRGADSVRAHLAALGELATTDSAAVTMYSTAEGRLLVLTRTTIRVAESRRIGHRSGLRAGATTVQVIAIPTFDDRGDVGALDVFIDDLPVFDRRAPRDDGIRVVSLAMQRNLEQVRALYGRGGAARFIAANAHQVVVLVDDAGNGPGAGAAVMRYRFDAAGRVKQVEQFSPSCLVAMAFKTTAR